MLRLRCSVARHDAEALVVALQRTGGAQRLRVDEAAGHDDTMVLDGDLSAAVADETSTSHRSRLPTADYLLTHLEVFAPDAARAQVARSLSAPPRKLAADGLVERRVMTTKPADRRIRAHRTRPRAPARRRRHRQCRPQAQQRKQATAST
jgi:hypothetical protein